jgi:hypothetical protein
MEANRTTAGENPDTKKPAISSGFPKYSGGDLNPHALAGTTT